MDINIILGSFTYLMIQKIVQCLCAWFVAFTRAVCDWNDAQFDRSN